MYERIVITELSNSAILNVAKTLDATGLLQQHEDLCYLKIDDRYIHLLQPILAQEANVDKPPYFSPPDEVGAHISVIYPEERIRPLQAYIGDSYSFSVCQLLKAQYGLLEYYVLSITSPSLGAFREMHRLAPRPTFKDQEVMFHITIGVRKIDSG